MARRQAPALGVARRESHLFKGPEARRQEPHPEAVIGCMRLLQIDDAAYRQFTELPIDRGEPVFARFHEARPGDVKIAAVPQLQGCKFLRAPPESMRDIVPRDDEVLPVISAPAQDDMDVRVIGVVVIDGDPVEFRSQIAFRRRHDVAREFAEVLKLAGIFRRHNDAKLMAVALPFLQERRAIDAVARRPVELSRRSVPRSPVALDVTKMRAGFQDAALAQAHRADFDGDAPRAKFREGVSLHRESGGDPGAAPDMRERIAPPRALSERAGPSLLHRGGELGRIALCRTPAERPDAAELWAEIVLGAAHWAMRIDAHDADCHVHGNETCRLALHTRVWKALNLAILRLPPISSLTARFPLPKAEPRRR